MKEWLKAAAEAYHKRRENREAFINEKINTTKEKRDKAGRDVQEGGELTVQCEVEEKSKRL